MSGFIYHIRMPSLFSQYTFQLLPLPSRSRRATHLRQNFGNTL